MSVNSLNILNIHPLAAQPPVQYLRKPSFLYRYVYHEVEILDDSREPGVLRPDYCLCIDESGSGNAATFRLEA